MKACYNSIIKGAARPEKRKVKNNMPKYIVTWRRRTMNGGNEWNYFYCDTLKEAYAFKRECEKVKGNAVESINKY